MYTDLAQYTEEKVIIPITRKPTWKILLFINKLHYCFVLMFLCYYYGYRIESAHGARLNESLFSTWNMPLFVFPEEKKKEVSLSKLIISSYFVFKKQEHVCQNIIYLILLKILYFFFKTLHANLTS